MAGKEGKGKGAGDQPKADASENPFDFDVRINDDLSIADEEEDVALEFGAPIASGNSDAKPPVFSGDDEFADILSDEPVAAAPAAVEPPPPPPAPVAPVAASVRAPAARPVADPEPARPARPEPAQSAAMPDEDDFGSEDASGFGEPGDPFQDDVFGEEDLDLAGVPPLPGEKPVQTAAQRRNADAEFGDIGDDAPGRDAFDDQDALTEASEAGFDEEDDADAGNAFEEEEIEEVEITHVQSSGGNRAVKAGVYVMMALLLVGTAYIGYTTVLPMFIGQSAPVQQVDTGPVGTEMPSAPELPAFPPVAQAPDMPAPDMPAPPAGAPDLTVVSPGPGVGPDGSFGGDGQVAQIPGFTGPVNGSPPSGPVFVPPQAGEGTILGGPIVAQEPILPGEPPLAQGPDVAPPVVVPSTQPDGVFPGMPTMPSDVAPIRENAPVIAGEPRVDGPVAAALGDDASVLASIRDEIARVREQGDALATRVAALESADAQRISEIESRIAGIERKVEEEPAAPAVAAPARPSPSPARASEPAREKPKPATERRRAAQPDARRDNPPRHNRQFRPAEKPPLVAQYKLSGISSGRAVVRSAAGFQEVGVGTVLPGAGKVQSIRNVGGDWVVTTENGVIVR